MTFDEVSNAVWHDKGKGLREKEARWLIEFCLDYKPDTVLDIGTGWGVTGRIFSLTAQKVFSVDKTPAGYARKSIAEHGNADRVTFIQSDSIDVNLPIAPHSADMCFIDAGHPTLYVIADYMKYSRFVKDGGVICFHDCDRKDVLVAVDLIEKQNPRLQGGFSLRRFHEVDITRAYYWEKDVQFKPVDINRVDPEKAKK